MSDTERSMTLPSAAPDAIATVAAEFADLDPAQLRKVIADGVRLTGVQILRMAAAVRVLEDRGEDLSDLPPGLVGRLRRVAYGHLLPEIVARYSGQPHLLNRVMGLPLPDQRRIADAGALPVATVGEGGAIGTRVVPVANFGRGEIEQVFGGGGIRTEAEQAAYLRGRLRQPDGPGRRKRTGVLIRGAFIPVPADRLQRLMAELELEDAAAGDDADPGRKRGRRPWHHDPERAAKALHLDGLGVPVARIARDLGLSPLTVSSGLAELRAKAGPPAP